MKSLRRFAALPTLALLAGCGEPSSEDVQKAFGHRITDVNCAQANGQPGYVCSFNYLGKSVTRRFVKLESGAWDLVF